MLVSQNHVSLPKFKDLQREKRYHAHFLDYRHLIGFCVKGWPTGSDSSHAQLGPCGVAQELDSVTTQPNRVTEQKQVAIGKDVVDEVERQNWKRDTKLDHRNKMAKCNNSKLNWNGVLQFVIIKWRISTS